MNHVNSLVETATIDLKAELAAMRPQEVRKGMIDIGYTASGQSLGIPYVLLRGETVNPCLWINAAVHGHESPGPAAVVNFLNRLKGMKLQGSLIVTPVANPTAIDSKMKVSPYDGVDLDDSFPGKPFLHSDRVAQKLFTAASSTADFMVSIHTNGTPMDAGVYTVFKDPSSAGISEETMYALMSAFRPQMACRIQADSQSEVPRNLNGAIDAQMLLKGIPAFMVEFGGGGVWDHEVMEQSIEGLFNLCQQTGVLESLSSNNLGSDQLVVVDARAHITTGIGGFFRPFKRPGEIVQPHDVIGETMNVYGEKVEELSFDNVVLLIAVRKEPVTHPGERLALVGYTWQTVPVLPLS